MGSGGGSTVPSNTSTTTNPWSGAIPYLTGGGGPRSGGGTGTGVVGGGGFSPGGGINIQDIINGTFNPQSFGPGAGESGEPEGIFPAASRYFETYQNLSPEQTSLRNEYFGKLENRQGNLQNIYGDRRFRSGEFDPNINAIDVRSPNAVRADAPERVDARTPNAIRADAPGVVTARTPNAIRADAAERVTARTPNAIRADAPGVVTARTPDAIRADAAERVTARSPDAIRQILGEDFQSLGDINPEDALAEILRGDPTSNPFLEQLNQKNINQATRAFRRNTRELQESVLPQIRREAFASGGYGGSRQGIAEGLAIAEAQRGAADLSEAALDSGNQIYGSAFADAQARQAAAARDLSGLASQSGQFTAGQSNQVREANANREFAASTGNQQLDAEINRFNAEQRNRVIEANANREFGANTGNQQLDAEINRFNAQQRNQVREANANRELTANTGNQQLDAAIDQFNAQQRNQVREANANRELTANTGNQQLDAAIDQFNAQQRNQTREANANRELTANTGNQQLDAQIDQFNAQQRNQVREANANRFFQGDVANNEFALQDAAARAGNALTGSTLGAQRLDASTNIYDQMQSLLGMDEAQFRDALNQYASIISPGANYGESSTSSTPIFQNSFAQNLGGVASAAGAFGGLLR